MRLLDIANEQKDYSKKQLNHTTVLVTGGAGYIGSHACLELLNNNYRVVVIDNLSNSNISSLKRVCKLSNKILTLNETSANADLIFYKANISDSDALKNVFKKHHIDAVIHFAGLKAVGESKKKPIEYYVNNVSGSITLFQEMAKANIKKIVFSSSATVYGAPNKMPITEEFNSGDTVNPYGQTKYFIENILEDISNADSDWKVCILRYFNPVGSHSSGLIGEDPKGIPNNLMPFISQVAVGKISKLKIFGNTYPTIDGTGVRDYIHVVDLVRGHISALDYITANQNPKFNIFNLGTGKGTSVLEILSAFEKINDIKVPYELVGERLGDVAECWASTKKAKSILGWEAKYTINDMCKDSWRWQSKNPNGYE